MMHVPAATAMRVVDPTGCGDAYRAGLIFGLMNGMDMATAGRIASLMGALKIEHLGPQNQRFDYDRSPSSSASNSVTRSAERSKNLKAMVMVESFVFETQFSYGSSVPSKWNNFVNSLIAAGHLSYNNPSASTVIAFFVIDEPELHNLKDIGGQPHPAVSNAVATIKNHPATASFVTAATFSKKYMDAYNSVRLVDWAAMDDYSLNDASYISARSSDLASGLYLCRKHHMEDP
jgi:hypothetical protein